jgi:hypothetical protein
MTSKPRSVGETGWRHVVPLSASEPSCCVRCESCMRLHMVLYLDVEPCRYTYHHETCEGPAVSVAVRLASGFFLVQSTVWMTKHRLRRPILEDLSPSWHFLFEHFRFTLTSPDIPPHSDASTPTCTMPQQWDLVKQSNVAVFVRNGNSSGAKVPRPPQEPVVIRAQNGSKSFQYIGPDQSYVTEMALDVAERLMNSRRCRFLRRTCCAFHLLTSVEEQKL